MKDPGYSTSQFLLSALAVGIITFNAARLGWGGCLAIAIAAGLYALSRRSVAP